MNHTARDSLRYIASYGAFIEYCVESLTGDRGDVDEERIDDVVDQLLHLRNIIYYENNLHDSRRRSYDSGFPVWEIQKFPGVQPAFEDEPEQIVIHEMQVCRYPDGQHLHPIIRELRAKQTG